MGSPKGSRDAAQQDAGKKKSDGGPSRAKAHLTGKAHSAAAKTATYKQGFRGYAKSN
jgi:hypothetical protein